MIANFDSVKPDKGSGDDTGTNDIDLKCGDGSWASTGWNGEWGDWGEEMYCPSGYAVSGMNVQIEANQGSGDDTALNGVQLYCSEVIGKIFGVINP